MHAEAAEHLEQDRQEFFSDPANVRKMTQRLQAGHRDALRDIAREIRAAGIYSRKTPLCQVEMALLRRLHNTCSSTVTWHTFIQTTVGLGWFHTGDRRAA